ncbi:uncharacterized protein LOC110860125 [Folsomia candida]|uniref:uncharacterized protein LOC110860125 n=1 Tax=Folsomia candida TaxID=158441 RepID=UPI000B8FCCB1|nr:uncharacterized protein LOC110860125 [Folsomia candida]
MYSYLATSLKPPKSTYIFQNSTQIPKKNLFSIPLKMDVVVSTGVNNTISAVLTAYDASTFPTSENLWTSIDGASKEVKLEAKAGRGPRKTKKPLADEIQGHNAEYNFFRLWFFYLSKTARFNAVFTKAFKRYKILAQANETGVFTPSQLAECFAGITNYASVTQFAMGLLTKVVINVDQGVPPESIAKLQGLAYKVVKCKEEVFSRSKTADNRFQIKNWASIAEYLGMLLQYLACRGK